MKIFSYHDFNDQDPPMREVSWMKLKASVIAFYWDFSVYCYGLLLFAY